MSGDDKNKDFILLLPIDSNLAIGSIYECGKCRLVSKEMKNHLIDNNMFELVVKYNHLFE